MVILGIDPGLERVGYGVIEKQPHSVSVVSFGCITTNKNTSTEQRLHVIYQEVTGLIRRYHPDAISCEQLFYFKNSKTIITVGQARGVILLAATHSHIPLIQPTPLQVKSSLTSWGRAPKAQVQSMVQRLFHLPHPPKPDDAADALAIAYSGATLYTNIKFQALNSKQISMTKIQKPKRSLPSSQVLTWDPEMKKQKRKD